jgi:type VI secretion system protein ImpL
VRELLRYIPLPPRWATTLLGALALGTLLWYLGPTLGFGGFRPLESVTVRLVVVAVLLAAWLAVTWFMHAREVAANKKMIEGAAGGQDSAADPAGAQVATLRQHLEEAQRHLKRLHGADRRGKKYLYELPWYILIGPPGAGKTTALLNCGLKFPLAERYGNRPVRGAAGTRNCDWFLTDEAVLIDTAGRYTTQDSSATEDQAAWLGFLDLLKEYRPAQPINGVLVAISLTDLITLPQEERRAHAAAVRARLGELLKRFAVRFPVYVLFTKADLIAGFVEAFEPLGREEREQVWGMTLPLDPGGDADPAVLQFGDEFRLLLGRLNERVIDRVQEEAETRRRGMIFGLPTQIVSLTETVREFLEEVFLASRFDTRPLLRGVYFTSGTQEGTPIDRLMSAIAHRFGLHGQRLTAFSGGGRSYFLTRLLREVIFAEASIVSTDPRVERRQRLLRWAFYGVVGLIFILTTGAWTVSYIENKRLEEQVAAAVNAATQGIAPLSTPVLKDDDLLKVVGALDALRNLPGGYEAANESAPLFMGFGLYQGARLHSEEVSAYRRALNLLLLPRLVSRLQKQLVANLTKPEFLYDGLRIYLMLGGRHPLDPKIVKEWMDLDWQSAYPGQQNSAARTALLGHLAALTEAPLLEYPLEGNVVEEARRTLRQFPPAGRAYIMLKDRLAAAQPPAWNIVDYAGPAADRALMRRSGKLLSDGVSGLYTRSFFHQEVLPRLPDLVKAVEDDGWILSDAPAGKPTDRSETLTADVLALYYADYIKQWEMLLGDISVEPARNVAQAADILNFAAGPSSPLKMVWQAIDREAQLRHRPAPPAGSGPPAAAPASSTENRIAAALGPGPNAQPGYGQPVEDRFRPFHDTVASVGGGAPLMDLFLQDLAELSKVASRLAVQTSDGPGPTALVADADEVAHKIESWSTRFPPMIADVPKSIARNALAVVKGEARGDLDRQWNARVLPFCKQALEGRYPGRRDAAADVAIDDFARLFAPNGLIDGFFSTSMRPFVDTSQNPWRLRSGDMGGVSFAADTLAQFQRAARIRDSFFASGNTPSLRFEITPISMDPEAARSVLSIDGQEIAFDGTSPRPIVIQWPGPSGVRQSTLGFETRQADPKPVNANQPAAAQPAATQPAAAQPASTPQPVTPTITKSGAWSFFRLLDAGRLERTGGPDRFRVSFSSGGHSAAYEIHAGSVVNPLSSRDLSEFQCPSTL